MQIDPGTIQIDRIERRRRAPIGVEACRIVSFAGVVEQIELDGEALVDSGISQAAGRSHGRGCTTLDRKRHTFSQRIGVQKAGDLLKGKLRGKPRATLTRLRVKTLSVWFVPPSVNCRVCRTVAHSRHSSH